MISRTDKIILDTNISLYVYKSKYNHTGSFQVADTIKTNYGFPASIQYFMIN